MLKIKHNKDYRIDSRNVNSIIILSTFTILLLYLLNSFLFDDIKQVWADSVIANITVGTNPYGVAYDSNDGRVYVANSGSNTVSVIDTKTNTVVVTIPVGTTPQGVAYDSNDGRVYVANSGSNTVSVIDTKTNTVVVTIPVGTTPQGVAYDSNDGRVYVTNAVSNTVSVIDTKTNTVVVTIPVGTTPQGVAYDSNDGRVYVTNAVSNTVSVIDTKTNTVTTIPGVGNTPLGVAYDSNDGRVYVTNFLDNIVSVIDTKTNTVTTTTMGIGKGPVGVTYDSNDGRVYITNSNSNTVSVIDTKTNTVTTIPGVGNTPLGVAYDSNDGRVYVANFHSNTVSVIATSQYPHHTTITSAVDGNNNPVSNGGSTLSTSITFTVKATADTNPISGFQCSLDNSPFSSCGTAATNNTGTITFNNLAAGHQHTVNIRAVDNQSNVDPIPATFSWFITQTQPPSNTAITSAKDGNGNTVQSGGSTSSTSITFTVRATAGTNPIAGFQCSLDNNSPSFSSCGTPNANPTTVTYNSLQPGQHMFKVRSLDTQGNVDSIPATFSWTVIQPNNNTVANGGFGGTGGTAIAHSGNANGGVGGNGGSDFNRGHNWDGNGGFDRHSGAASSIANNGEHGDSDNINSVPMLSKIL